MRRFENQFVILIVAVLCAWLVFLLTGCKSKQAVVRESEAAEVIDTTRAVTDSTAAAVEVIDTSKTTQTYADSLVFEFVPGGGSVTIDSAGNISFVGVSKVRKGTSYRAESKTAVSAKETAESTHKETNNGITNKRQRQYENETKTVARKWYETILIKIGTAVCIAAILWAIFLYIRRKF